MDQQSASYQKRLAKATASQELLQRLAERVVRRQLQGNNIESVECFINFNKTYFDRMGALLQWSRVATGAQLSGPAKPAELGEMKRLIEGWLYDSFTQYHSTYADFLTPLYFGMIVVRDCIECKLGAARVSAGEFRVFDCVEQYAKCVGQTFAQTEQILDDIFRF